MSKPLGEVARQPTAWLRDSGPLHEIVISTRIRLARNIAGYNFLSRAKAPMREEIADTITRAIRKSPEMGALTHVDVEELDPLDRRLLVERQLISRQHAEGDGARRVVFDDQEVASIMINEEDHVRMQVMRSGLELEAAWKQIGTLDDGLSQHLEFAFDPQYGYLTACPTNVGTGIRVSVMLHLPALRLTKELEKVGQAAKELKLAVRGLFGEGTDALGDFFQISNQITLGRSEEEIIDDFRRVVIPKIVEYEQAARDALVRQRTFALDDRIYRALGLLRSARLISSSEAMEFLSHVRMGLHVGRIKQIELETVNELFIQTQPAHLQKLYGSKLNGEQRGVARAELIRTRLSSN